MTEPQNPFGDMPQPPAAPDPAQAQASYQQTYGQPQGQPQGSQPYGQPQGQPQPQPQQSYQGQQAYSGYTQSATGQYTPGYQQVYQQPVAPAQPVPLYPMTDNDRNLRLVAFIFCILSLIGSCWLIIPLAWMIPMCVVSWGIYKGTKANTVAFGVCTLIFVSLVAGILLLCSKKDR